MMLQFIAYIGLPLCVFDVPDSIFYLGAVSTDRFCHFSSVSSLKERDRNFKVAITIVFSHLSHLSFTTFLPTCPGGRAVSGVGVRPVDCWDRGFESYWGHGCLSLCLLCAA
jgi:hypothetical protein